MRLRRIAAIGAIAGVISIGLPGAVAHSAGEPCNDQLPAGTPSYVVCRWLAKPDEALQVAMNWLADDARHLQQAEPHGSGWPSIDITCTDGPCPPGEGGAYDENEPGPAGDDEDGGPIVCDPPGSTCTVEPDEVVAAAQSPAGEAVEIAGTEGLRVWINTELADDWKAGEQQFAAAVKHIGALAAQPGVAGIRFTNQLGYNDTFATAEELTKFVAAASAALRQVAPGTKLGIHTVVPEFACGGHNGCVRTMTTQYPLLTAKVIEPLLTGGKIDQLTLDSGMAPGYGQWKITPQEARRNQWIQVKARAWDALAQVGAEDAGLVGGSLTEAQAKAATAQRVVLPLEDGAATVNVWSRYLDAKGTVHGIPAATWAQLEKLEPLQRRLTTFYTPGTDDLAKLAKVFSQVYITV
ncbi:hypothetical protein Aph01nite_79790 [Acrocarpospora phusangensis]|uniref:Uncharacterized protein n=1 Tax=Acrocarpospora phusangensis TaxID=1070424 RepID=A0A919QIH9_9ACTN|nr:hypothetical protein [Acrocarpospora phusangensis]GIH29669.1 hypothetical protein Aph01nite_79790 [Acrocarpospora phusangensis]